ncbi:MAG: MlaD family protein [Solirubrobacteraceae bacterium]
MRRLATILVVLAAGALALLATGAGDDTPAANTYWVEVDNAFGLIEGADVKVAGVRAGQIEAMELDVDKLTARVRIRIDEEGFGDLRTDAFCETKPQSLIGEYFVDCRPGKGERLRDGATVPVEQTASTVPADLIQDIMRRPYRQRFSILISELGGALAGRGEDLNETIRRLSPALREVDRVLAVLAQERMVIRDLYENADKVLNAAAGKRQFIGRYVEELRDTARAYGNRTDDIQRQFEKLPTFLQELRPTLKALGESADEQAPALANLQRSAPDLRRLLTTLGTFSQVSRPNFRALGSAAERGSRALLTARPNIRLLGRSVKTLPETAQNLAITLEHLDDPDFAVEKDARAGRPDGGYTGFEALLRYIHAQGQAINLFDANNYILKVTAFPDKDCQSFATPANVESLPDRCKAYLGPNQPGINSPDPTATPAPAAAAKARDARAARTAAQDTQQAEAEAAAAAAANTRALDYLLGE